MNVDIISLGAIWYLIFLLSSSLHEGFHAFAGYKLGDKTAFYAGQLTLNPLAHIKREPFGMVLVPIISFALSGWMIGWASVPYNLNWSLQFPKKSALMAAAGPFANFLLLLIGILIVKTGIYFGIFYPPTSISFTSLVQTTNNNIFNSVSVFLSILITLNLLLFLFNLLPVPPLDGSSIIPLFLSEKLGVKFKMLMFNPIVGLAGLFFAWQFFGYIFKPFFMILIKVLYPDYNYG